MKKFDISMLHPNQTRNTDLLSIRGVNVKRSTQLQDALEELGLSKDDAIEAITIIMNRK